ncbi:myb family transcription factor APL-like [Panicum miliaceum]|uniref:Myb family transcription factor APL-like n=1 Tax=Panicum miliaceum TaxID=4540 RepID=A0A3L6TK24_PANMI|nr:myb family transcription factor APL-like [Panicum miliaceum]
MTELFEAAWMPHVWLPRVMQLACKARVGGPYPRFFFLVRSFASQTAAAAAFYCAQPHDLRCKPPPPLPGQAGEGSNEYDEDAAAEWEHGADAEGGAEKAAVADRGCQFRDTRSSRAYGFHACLAWQVQRHLQLRIEAQGRYLQSVLRRAEEVLADHSLGSPAARAEFSELASAVESGCLSCSSLPSPSPPRHRSANSCVTSSSKAERQAGAGSKRPCTYGTREREERRTRE